MTGDEHWTETALARERFRRARYPWLPRCPFLAEAAGRNVIERVLDALVRRVRAQAPGFDVNLRWDDRVGRCSTTGPCRQFAACEDTRPPTIYVASRLALEPRARVEGVLAHELGHAILFLAGQPDHTERAADEAAEAYLSLHIRYDAGDVQTTGPGARPRPARLG